MTECTPPHYINNRPHWNVGDIVPTVMFDGISVTHTYGNGVGEIIKISADGNIYTVRMSEGHPITLHRRQIALNDGLDPGDED